MFRKGADTKLSKTTKRGGIVSAFQFVQPENRQAPEKERERERTTIDGRSSSSRALTDFFIYTVSSSRGRCSEESFSSVRVLIIDFSRAYPVARYMIIWMVKVPITRCEKFP